MADRLTQLQDCLDQLAKQMYASLMYTLHHSAPSPFPASRTNTSTSSPLPTAPRTASPPTIPPTRTQNSNKQPRRIPQPTPTTQPVPAPRPRPPAVFASTLRELARDLIVKEQQIEALIASLPGIGTSEKEQVERIAELERQLREVEEERKEAVREKREVLRRLDSAIVGVKIP
ncbi:Mediator of RNA polymerase II transcription subunit 21 [Coniosporium tulheliwenetii]|uniref:Mediator of RNA polymerase II transcription subunit 21 n=1 Tax=Coniosporium tulheliwenetii TaxID=3383036 RepID=A0ACC2YN02_9PEZI|nr:Mediator of RNA polymerase II transcription subunit 21 [Cladosporium sp. JES 115]